MTASSRGAEGGCASTIGHPHTWLMPVWLPQELGTGTGRAGREALPKVTQGRGREALPAAAEPQHRDGDGSVPARAVLGTGDPRSASHDTPSCKSNSKQQ